MDTLLLYDATGEQVQSWHYHNSLSDGQLHEVVMVQSIVKDMDLAAMEKSIEWMIRRHDSLRTFFRVTDEAVRQCVTCYDPEMFSPLYYDMTAIDGNDSLISSINGIVDECKYHIRDLSTPPLVRSCIFKVPDNNHYLCIMIHHIISDERSAALIYKEVAAIYPKFRDRQAIDMPLPAVQLKDYALWQRKWLEEEGDNVRGYWAAKLESLKDAPDVAALYKQYRNLSGFPMMDDDGDGPMTRKRLIGILKEHTAASYIHCIDSQGYRELIRLSLSYNVNICSVFIASMQLLFYFLADRKRVLMPMPVSSRHFAGAESIIGCLGGAIYLYSPVGREMSIGDLVGDAYVDFLESAQNLIFDHDQMELDGNDLRINCGVYMNFVGKEIIGEQPLPAADLRVHKPLGESAFYALSYSITEYRGAFSGSWRYNVNLYTPERISFMVETYEAILREMCLDPGMTVGQLARKIKTSE
jgi:hypothetical protein